MMIFYVYIDHCMNFSINYKNYHLINYCFTNDSFLGNGRIFVSDQQHIWWRVPQRYPVSDNTSKQLIHQCVTFNSTPWFFVNVIINS